MKPIDWVRTSLIALCICSAIAILTIALSINYALAALPQVIEREMAATRQDLIAQITLTRDHLDWQLSTTRQAALDESAKYRKDLAKHVYTSQALINYDWAETVNALTTTIDSNINTTNQILFNAAGAALQASVPITANVEEVTSNLNTLTIRLNDQEPMIYSRYLGMTGELNRTLDATRRMAETFAKETPEIASSVKETSANVAQITSDVKVYTHPKGFFRSLLFPALSAIGGIF